MQSDYKKGFDDAANICLEVIGNVNKFDDVGFIMDVIGEKLEEKFRERATMQSDELNIIKKIIKMEENKCPCCNNTMNEKNILIKCAACGFSIERQKHNPFVEVKSD